jgi:hypothetical protein
VRSPAQGADGILDGRLHKQLAAEIVSERTIKVDRA